MKVCFLKNNTILLGTQAKKIADPNEKIGSQEVRSRTNCIKFVLIEEIQFKMQ